MEIKNGTGLTNKRTGSLATIHEQFPHNGPDTDWQVVTCYHVWMIEKGIYKYINYDNLIKNWNILTEKEYWKKYNDFFRKEYGAK